MTGLSISGYETAIYFAAFLGGAIPLLLLRDTLRHRHEHWFRWLQIVVYGLGIIGAAVAGYRGVESLLG